MTPDMASHVAAGFAQNSSVKHLTLSECIGIVMSGIPASKIDSLTLHPHGSTAINYATMAKMLPVAPLLKMLNINNTSNREAGGGISSNELFCALAHPWCGVENLELWAGRLGTAEVEPATRVNRNLHVLALNQIIFHNNRSVSLLWHLVGLKELQVSVPFF
jgi:hypothetical protein